MLSWLIFPCRLLHLSSSEIQLGCCTVKVNACGPIPASPLGGKGGERYPEDGGEGQQQQTRSGGIKRKRQKPLGKAELKSTGRAVSTCGGELRDGAALRRGSGHDGYQGLTCAD